MVLMESYFFCASVRLGVLIISAVALFKSIVIIYVVSTYGLGFMLNVILSLDINLSYRASYYLVRDTILWMETYPQVISTLLEIYSIGHITSCSFSIYGAYKIKKNFIIPLIIFEFSYLVEVVTLLILFLRILRHFLSLINLIFLTICATFYAILVAYDFVALVAFEQIVRLVTSPRYQQLYGKDPLNPKAQLVNLSEQSRKLPAIIYVMPKMSLKWWHSDSHGTTSDDALDAQEMHKYFQSQELLPDVITHNAWKVDYSRKFIMN